MSKVSRFEAFAKGLKSATTAIKKGQVDNVIEKARLSAELALTNASVRVEKAAAALVSEPTEANLNILAEAIQSQADIKTSVKVADTIKAYLAEEVEVEDDKKSK